MKSPIHLAIKQKPSESPSQEIPLEELLKPIKQLIGNNPEKCILNYDQIKNFLENAYGNNDPLKLSMDYMADAEKLIQMLTNIYTHITHRSIKSRITRLNKKL